MIDDALARDDSVTTLAAPVVERALRGDRRPKTAAFFESLLRGDTKNARGKSGVKPALTRNCERRPFGSREPEHPAVRRTSPCPRGREPDVDRGAAAFRRGDLSMAKVD